MDNDKYKIKGVGRTFWSELVRCKFKDVPLLNDKTEEFFGSIGLCPGFSSEEKLKSIAYCYKRWAKIYKEQTDKKISLLKLSHIEHFATREEEGKKLIVEAFGE